MFYCFIFAAGVKLFDLHLRQCRRCFYALPDGAFTASSVPRDAQLHGRASQISARKSTTGNVCLSVLYSCQIVNDYNISQISKDSRKLVERRLGWWVGWVNKHPYNTATSDGHLFLDIFVQYQNRE